MEVKEVSFLEKTQNYNQPEKKKIEEAISLARKNIPDQGEIDRALGVASLLIDLNMDADTVIAAIFQKAIAGSDARETVNAAFGITVELLAGGAAELAGINTVNKTIHEAENIRKMFFALASDIRVILIRLADKLYTMQNLDEFSPDERKLQAQECIDIYAPLADRLGISWLKDELEDIALKYLNPEAFIQIKEIVSLNKDERERILETMKKDVSEAAAESGISIDISSRAKHFYSIYQKMRKRNKSVDEIFDLFGIRITCDTIENCYTLLGIVHRLYRPVNGQFDDYIAKPKPNGYQSLHTAVLSQEDRLLEIQIRTREMHLNAEYGIASHWLYKKGSNAKIVGQSPLSIVNKLRQWNLNMGDTQLAADFFNDIKQDMLKGSIFVFTPQGKVICLPSGATPIDFAYQIHTSIGNHCIGAKSNGSIIPLSSELQNTNVVEIMTSPLAHPHLNWLETAKTSKARGKIRAWLQQNDESVINERNAAAKKKQAEEQYHLAKAADTVTAAAKEEPQRFLLQEQREGAPSLKVRVGDEKNIMIRFAKCCHPVYGDPIMGYISRGRGIIIHHSNCGNIRNINGIGEREISVEWENSSAVLVKRLKIEARHSRTLFSEIEGAVRKHQGHLIEGRLEETRANHLTGFFTLQLEKQDDFKYIIKNIRGIPSVFSAQLLN